MAKRKKSRDQKHLGSIHLCASRCERGGARPERAQNTQKVLFASLKNLQGTTPDESRAIFPQQLCVGSFCVARGVTLERLAMLRVLVVSSAASEPTAVEASLLATALWRMNYEDG